MPDKQIHPTGTEAVPADYPIPSGAELLLKSVYAKFDGSAAAGSFVPLVRIISDAGSVTDEIPQDTTIAAGGSADATWFPRVGAAATSTGPGSLPVAFLDRTTQISLTAWGGFFTAVTWELFETGDTSTFSWPSGGDATKVNLATPGVYRMVYVYQVDGLNFPAAGNQILSTVDVSVAGATTQTLSLDRTTGALYRGDPSVGTPWGATGERVFNIVTAQDVRLFVAYTGAGTQKIDTFAAFIYKIGAL